ncbi:MAG: UDP-3-O-acyl-N-acetylglucosamine deacetylase, partial [Candidatus Omnitrophica bacterium]|nr:UDP-3-O-acyl-N-acetylglucosamine deacetylase [Candidatus Omnitrophota bacterium]
MEKQRTIAREFKLKGAGLHTGSKVNMVFKPADADSGINFIRVDLESKPVIKASLDNVLPSELRLRRTSIGQNGSCVHTIEHLMAALLGLGIDNLYIEIDNEEVPALDGSSLNFAEA